MIRRHLRCFLPLAITLAAAADLAATLELADFRCEGLREAPQVDTPAPRFSWRLDSDARDVRQTAWQLRVSEIDASGTTVGSPLESKRIESDETQWNLIPGFKAAARSTYAWQVRAWDNHDQASEWSEPQRFGTGLIGSKWPAEWIGDGRNVPLYQTSPARHFRNSFQVDRPPVRARLYVSAFGLVEPWLNGKLVTEDKFIPGWPDYRRRVFYAAFDVTDLIQPGDNTLGMILGDGWFSGTMIPRHQYGQQPRFSALLDLTDSDGTVTTLITDENWRWTDAGPITLNSIYDGESYDARRELAGWSNAVPADKAKWQPGVTGLLIAAIFAAGMSTISTSLNSAATVVHSDFFLRFFRPKADGRASLRVLRLATLAFGVVGTSVSFLLLNVASALDAWWTLSSIFSGGILGLFLLGLLCRRASNPAAAAAVVCGLLVIAWITLSSAGAWPESLGYAESPFHAFLAIVLGTLTILFGGIVLSAFIPRKLTYPSVS